MPVARLTLSDKKPPRGRPGRRRTTKKPIPPTPPRYLGRFLLKIRPFRRLSVQPFLRARRGDPGLYKSLDNEIGKVRSRSNRLPLYHIFILLSNFPIRAIPSSQGVYFKILGSFGDGDSSRISRAVGPVGNRSNSRAAPCGAASARRDKPARSRRACYTGGRSAAWLARGGFNRSLCHPEI